MWTYLWTGADLESYDGLEDIRKLEKTPILIIHGTKDNIIPSSESELLSKAAPSGTEAWFIEGADHLQGIGTAQYAERVRGFLGR